MLLAIKPKCPKGEERPNICIQKSSLQWHTDTCEWKFSYPLKRTSFVWVDMGHVDTDVINEKRSKDVTETSGNPSWYAFPLFTEKKWHDAGVWLYKYIYIYTLAWWLMELFWLFMQIWTCTKRVNIKTLWLNDNIFHFAVAVTSV